MKQIISDGVMVNINTSDPAYMFAATIPATPEFKSKVLVKTKPENLVFGETIAGDYYYHPDSDRLYRLTTDHKLVSPLDGREPEPHEFKIGDTFWAVSDPYSKEFIAAYLAKNNGIDVDAVVAEPPTPVDQSVIQSLDAKAENDVVNTGDVDLFAAAAEVFAQYQQNKDTSASTQEAVINSIQKYADSAGLTYTAAHDEIAATYNYDAVEFPMETPPVAGAVGHSINGVHPSLAVSDPFETSTIDDAKAKSLVGKMVMIVRNDLIPEDEDTVALGNGSGVSFLTAYVEGFDASTGNERLRLRTSYGAIRNVNVGSSYYASSNNAGTWRVVENLSPDILKTSGAPVLKADGTIVHNGKVVGTWDKDGYYGPTKFTLNAEHTIIGKNITGSNYKKTALRNRVHSMLLPEAPPVKVKKGSKAAEKIEAAIFAIPTLDATYANGEKAALGDWIGYTKGGGGFVGKIVGWPNQDTDPSIVFAVSPDGVQKAININGSIKKVSKPASADTGTGAVPGQSWVGNVPSSYGDLKLAGGETPQVGQKVIAGKPGKTKVEGYIHHINPKNGWVYITTADGKQVPHTLSVTTLVEEPELWWNAPSPAIASVLATPVKAKGGKKKVAGANYPGPDGAVVAHDPVKEQAWLDGHPKRKLTKDGYAPVPGMRVRNKTGDDLVVLFVADDWAANPNRLTTWNITQKKKAASSTNSVELDHASILTAYDGEAIKKVAGVITDDSGSILQPPDGTTIWRTATSEEVWNPSTSSYRKFSDWRYVAISPDGSAWEMKWKGELSSLYQGLAYSFHYYHPEKMEKVAEIDSTSPAKLEITLKSGNAYKNTLVPSSINFIDVPGEPDTEPVHIPEAAPEPPLVDTPTFTPVGNNPYTPGTNDYYDAMAKANGLEVGYFKSGEFSDSWSEAAKAGAEAIVMRSPNGVFGIKELPDGSVLGPDGNPSPASFNGVEGYAFYSGTQENVDKFLDLAGWGNSEVVPQDTIDLATTTLTPDVVPEPELDVSNIPEPDVTGEAKKLDSNQLVTWKPPPAPPTAAPSNVPADPVLPAVTGATDLADKPSSLPQARSMAEGVKAMLEKKDSKDAGSAFVYSTGDSDYIEDMAVRYNVEKRNDGTEHLLMRFRLREDVSEDTIAKLVTLGAHTAKTGAWKTAGIKFAKGLQDGDLINVYVSGSGATSGFLKPSSTGQHPTDEPNSRVVGTPKFVGKSPVNVDNDLYRVTVITQNGAVGEVDMEQRADGNILTFEYDHNAPAKSSGDKLKMTNTALQDGWSDNGVMTMQGSKGSVLVDETGKVTWNGGNVGKISGGNSGGRNMRRINSDGTVVILNAAHTTEGGTGFDQTRRANIAGEVQISTPISSDRPVEDVVKSMSEAMQQVGVPVEKQGAATDSQLLTFALNKMVTNFHPKYDYRAKPVESVNDPRVNETFAHMNAKLQQHLGRNVTLDDVKIHFFENGRMAVVWSPEVAMAISKAQGAHHYKHHGVHDPFNVLGSSANGLMSTDERWSLGVLTTGLSSWTDMTIGSGDRVYMHPASSYPSANVILSPLAVNSNMDVYTKGRVNGITDHFGRRSEENKTLIPTDGFEYMLKRKVEPEQITFWIADSESQREAILKKFKDAGKETIGGRPVADIIVTSEQAKKMDMSKIGIEHFANDISITKLFGLAA